MVRRKRLQAFRIDWASLGHVKVLFVCTGNLCRSPMAAALFKHAVDRRGCSGIEVTSAGTWGGEGHSATPEAVAVVGQKGVDLISHRSRVLDPAEVAEADVVVAMTSVHVREILDVAPEAAPKVVLLKVIPELHAGLDRDLAPEARVKALLGARRPEWRRAMDLDDPIGLPLLAYERCLGEIEVAIEALADVICGPKDGGAKDPPG